MSETAYSYQAPDRRVYDMLTGGQNRFGLLPQVEAYYQSQFENMGAADSNPFTYTGDRIAGFSPREEYAMQLADQGIGAYQPYMARAAGLTEEGLATMAGGSSEAAAAMRRAQQQGEDYTRLGINRGTDFLGRGVEKSLAAEKGLLNSLSGARARDEQGYQRGIAGLDQAGQTLQASRGDFDPSSISRYSDPYEDQVVQQVMRDMDKAQQQGDIGRRASEVGTGAFGGSRSQLTQQESDIANRRGMTEALAGIRSQGYTSSRDAAMADFGRARGADAMAAQQQAGMAGQGQQFGMNTAQQLSQAGQNIYGMGSGAGQNFYNMGTGTGQGLAGIAGGLAGAQTGAAGAYQGYAGANQGFRQGDVASAMNIGGMNRARNQAGLDLNYQNFVGQYNMPNQLMSGYANYLTGAGPLAGGTGYSGTANVSNPYGASGAGTYTGNYGLYENGGQIQRYEDGSQGGVEGPRGGINTPLQALELFGVDQETIDEMNMTAGDMPKGLVDLIISIGQKARDTGLLEEPKNAEKLAQGGIPKGNKGLAALSKVAPEVVRKMGFTPATKMMGGGIVNPRFPMASRKLGA